LIKQENNIERFKDVTIPLKGKLIFENISLDFSLLNNITNLQHSWPPNSSNIFTKLDISMMEISTFRYPKGNEWNLISILRSEYPKTTQVIQVSSMPSPQSLPRRKINVWLDRQVTI